MRIIDAVKNHKGSPFNIPDCTRAELPDFFKEMGYNVGAEIGVYKGAYHDLLLKTGVKLYGVDPYGTTTDNVNNTTERQNYLYKRIVGRLAPYPNSTLIRKTSMDAVNDFKDESLDFVYIDGDHRFRYIAEDLYEWSKKVRKGGIVSGHDYTNPKSHRNYFNVQVFFVVDAYIKHFAIKNWYVIGSERGMQKENGEWEVRDTWRSFFWIKE